MNPKEIAEKLVEDWEADLTRETLVLSRDQYLLEEAIAQAIEAAEKRGEEQLRLQSRVLMYRYRDRIAELERQVKRWEDKEVERAVCCMENEQRVKELERQLAEIVVVGPSGDEMDEAFEKTYVKDVWGIFPVPADLWQRAYNACKSQLRVIDRSEIEKVRKLMTEGYYDEKDQALALIDGWLEKTK